MSIAGLSAVSSAAYFQQLQQTPQAGTTAPAATAQTASVAQAGPTVQAGAPGQAGQIHHHHHRHGGGSAGQASDVTQSGTASAEATNILNTLV